MFLHKGRCFCEKCYSNFSTAETVFVARADTLSGKESVGLRLNTGCSEVRLDAASAQNYSIHGEPRIELERGIVEYIELEVCSHRDNDRVLTLVSDNTNRACPRCWEAGLIRYIPPLMGYTDSYLITMVGLNSVGKTSLVQSLNSNAVQNELVRLLGVNVSAFHNGNVVRPRATLQMQLHLSGGLQIQYPRHPLTVFFGDVPGETFRPEGGSAHTPFQTRFFNMLKRNSDALLVLHDQRDITLPSGLSFDPPVAPEDGHFANLINPVLSNISGRYTQVLCVLNKLDELEKTVRSSGGLLRDRSGEPFLTEDSPLFRPFDSKEDLATELTRHMACANDLMQELLSGAIPITDSTRCFAVSAGAVEGAVINYARNLNILLPLLYLLRCWPHS